MSKLNRRAFMLNSSAAGAIVPISLRAIVGGVVTGLVRKAIALEEHGVVPLNYVKLWLHDGMERWYFDGMHAPHGVDGHNFGTRYNRIKTIEEYSGKNYLTEMEYALTHEKVNGKFYLPYLWESMLPGLHGDVSMKELAKNMLTIRGVDTGIGFDAHGNNVNAAENPFGYAHSVGGLAPSVKSYPIPIGYNGGGRTPRADKLSSVEVDPSDVRETLSLFNGTGSGGVFYKTGTPAPNEVRALIDEFIGNIKKNMPASKQKVAESVLGTRKAAMELMEFTMSAVTEVQESFNEAKEAYASVVREVANKEDLESRKLKHLDDLVLSNPNRCSSFSSERKSELQNLFRKGNEDPYDNGLWDNFSPALKSVSFGSIVNALALSETYFKYNISNSLAFTVSSGSGELSNGLGDVHFSGGAMRLFAHSKLYQALSAGLIACLSRIKNIKDTEGHNVGERTVFHLRSEFDRKPLGDNGSNHQIRNCHETFFSNMIQNGPYIIGNVSKSSQNGLGLKFTKNKAIEYKHIYATVQSMCGLEKDRNFESFVERRGNKLVPLTDECEDV